MQMLSLICVSLCVCPRYILCTSLCFWQGDLSLRTLFHVLCIYWWFSPLCIHPCVYDQVTFMAKTLSTFYTYTLLFPLCVLVWVTKLPCAAKLFSHSIHTIWLFSCVYDQAFFRRKLFPYVIHPNVFSPVCVVCETSSLFWAKQFPHSLHTNGFSPVGILDVYI